MQKLEERCFLEGIFWQMYKREKAAERVRFCFWEDGLGDLAGGEK